MFGEVQYNLSLRQLHMIYLVIICCCFQFTYFYDYNKLIV